MKRIWFILTIFVLLFLSGCRRSEITETPAPAATFVGLPVQSQAVSLLTLLRNPVAFDESFVRVTGNYRPRPLLICGDDAHLSPATWALTTGDGEILASGFDNTLRTLAGEGRSLIVDGQWQQWEGPVGCGRRVPIERIWLLEVTEIVLPNPLAAIDQDELAAADGAGTETDPSLMIAATIDPLMTVTTLVVTENPPGSPETLPAVTPLPTPSGTSPAQSLGTATSTSTPRAPTNLTPTPAMTGTPQPTVLGNETLSPTVTVSPTTGTSVATDQAAATSTTTTTLTETAVPVPKTRLSYEMMIKSIIVASETQQYDFVGGVNDIATISVAPSPDLDISLGLIGPDGLTIGSQDQGGAGQVETIDKLNLTEQGEYQILVLANANGGGSYALALLDDFSEPYIVFQDILNYGDSVAGILEPGSDHLWNFMGTIGDTINIRLTSDGDDSVLFYLNDPEADDIEFQREDNGLAESIEFELPATGFYSIEVGESSFGSAAYTLTLELEP